MESTPLKAARVHIWIPDYESGMGGIQVFSRFFVRALVDCLPEAEISVLCKNDSFFPVLPRRVGDTRFYCAGWWPAKLRTAAFAWQLMVHTMRSQPDLILSTHVNFMPVASWANRLTGAACGAVAHGVDVWGRNSKGQLARALRKASRVMAVSEFTRGRLLEDLALAPSRVGVLPNTFDPEIFYPATKPRYLLKRFRLKPEQPVILTVARLASAERYKGYDQILRALPAIRKAVPDVHYILGGRGADRPRVEALIRELQLEEAVTLAGYVPDHELCDFYNLCDAFAMPSKGEGFGIVFLEALACGKPVLAGNKDGSVDALLDGKLGVLVDPDNVSEIAHNLILVLKRRHPLVILQQPEKLRAQVIEAYGYDRFVDRVGEQLTNLGFQPAKLEGYDSVAAVRAAQVSV